MLSLTALLSGCAHKITINPNMESFTTSKNISNTIVGYHISDVDKAKKVTTPGGGGDKVSYTPYKDIESALFTVLSNKFKDVYLVKSLDDKSFIKENEIKLIFIPNIITQSSSSSPFTWPPTKFIVDLTVKAIDTTGATIWKKQIKKTGEAKFSEFKSDFSLSARRATEQALAELAKELEKEPLFNK